MITIVRDRVAALIAAGMTLEQVLAAQPIERLRRNLRGPGRPDARAVRRRALSRPQGSAAMSAHAWRAAVLAAAYAALLSSPDRQPSAPAAAAAAGHAPRARTRAVDLTGQWVSVITEDWRWRMVTPPVGDASSIPLNDRPGRYRGLGLRQRPRRKRLLQGVWTAGPHSATDAAAHRLARRGHAAHAVRRRQSDSALSLHAATGRRAIAPGRFDGELVQADAVARRVRREYADGRRLAAGSHDEPDGRGTCARTACLTARTLRSRNSSIRLRRRKPERGSS